MTKLAEHGMPQDLVGGLTDSPELAGGFCVFLSAPAKYAETDSEVRRGSVGSQHPHGFTSPTGTSLVYGM